jgi:exodeoxyribonuclease VII small subunit
MNNKTTTNHTLPPENGKPGGGPARSYQEAEEELERIVASLEQGDLNVDELANKVTIAKELLQYCKNALRSIEEKITGYMEDE